LPPFDHDSGLGGVLRPSNGTPACQRSSSPLGKSRMPAFVDPSHRALSPFTPSHFHCVTVDEPVGGQQLGADPLIER
jgi:hypothetical protein